MAGLSPAEIAAPIRGLLSRHRNVRVLREEVLGVDLAARRITTASGTLDYDVLVLACGAQHAYFGHDDWEEHAPGLKTLEQATEIRRRVLTAFEDAEKEPDPERKQALLTLRDRRRRADGRRARRRDRRDEPLHARARLPPDRSQAHARDPDRGRAAHPAVLLASRSRAAPCATSSSSACRSGRTARHAHRRRRRRARARAHPRPRPRCGPRACCRRALGAHARRAARSAGPRARRARSLPCRTPGGVRDRRSGPRGRRPMASRSPASRRSRCSRAATSRARSGRSRRPPAQAVSLSPTRARWRRSAAAARSSRSGALRFAGLLAWLLWIVVHIYYLTGFENRLLVVIQWAWSYVSFARGARLIVGKRWQVSTT